MAKRVQLAGNNIMGVSGASQGAQKNAAAMSRAGSAAGLAGAGAANFEFSSSLGANTASLTSTGATAGNARQKNAQAMQRAGSKAGK